MRWSEHTIDLKERELSLEGINFIDHNRSDYACIYLFCLAPLSPELLCPPIVSVRLRLTSRQYRHQQHRTKVLVHNKHKFTALKMEWQLSKN